VIKRKGSTAYIFCDELPRRLLRLQWPDTITMTQTVLK